MPVQVAVVFALLFFTPAAAGQIAFDALPDPARAVLDRDQLRERMRNGPKVPAGLPTRGFDSPRPVYLSTLHLLSPQERKWPTVELYTEDPQQAMRWSDESQSPSAYRELRARSETARHFEFIRATPGHPASVIVERVHKCSHFHAAPLDVGFLDEADVLLGALQRTPVTATEAFEFAFLHWDALQGSFGEVLVAGSRAEDSASVLVVLVDATQVFDFDSRQCPISLTDWHYTVARLTGEVRLTRKYRLHSRGPCA